MNFGHKTHNTMLAGGGLRLAAALGRGVLIGGVLIFVWWLLVRIFSPAPFILPGPERVVLVLYERFAYLAGHGLTTLVEIVLGLIAGTILGVATGMLALLSPSMGRLIQPVISTSQALPVFAIAPLLVIWFGLGLGSKVAMATIIIYFPIASSFIDGLERTDRGLIDLGQLYGATPLKMLLLIRLPAAMPSLASGLKVAATIAPIGAIVGEWVGSSAGLGFIILQSNARMQTDTVFAALFVLAIIAISVRALVGALLDHFIHWTPRTINRSGPMSDHT